MSTEVELRIIVPDKTVDHKRNIVAFTFALKVNFLKTTDLQIWKTYQEH